MLKCSNCKHSLGEAISTTFTVKVYWCSHCGTIHFTDEDTIENGDYREVQVPDVANVFRK